MFEKNWIDKDALNTPPLQEPRSVSAVYVDQLNIFDTQLHFDDAVIYFQIWDDGQNTSQALGWSADLKGYKSFSATVMYKWLTEEEAAVELNTTVDMLTPEKFDEMYEKVWTSYRKRADAGINNKNSAVASSSSLWTFALLSVFGMLLGKW